MFKYLVETVGLNPSEFEKLTLPRFIVLISDPEKKKAPPEVSMSTALKHIRQFQHEKFGRPLPS
jgi:hypothetical protein